MNENKVGNWTGLTSLSPLGPLGAGGNFGARLLGAIEDRPKMLHLKAFIWFNERESAGVLRKGSMIIAS